MPETTSLIEEPVRTAAWRPAVGKTLGSLAVSLRPQQWVKNTLVFSGLIFSHSLTRGPALALSCGAFVVFCLGSSALYLLNDLRDLEKDRRHPTKRLRPLAAGALRPALAWTFLPLLLAISVAGSAWLGPAFSSVLGIYLALNFGYSLGLKRVVILDVMIVAMGFVLRAVAGAVVIGAPPSHWLMLCTLMLALLVCFGKRRHELVLLQGEAHHHRPALDEYSLPFLDIIMAVAAGASVVTYALYTMAGETIARAGSSALIYTMPFVLYGIFRYLHLVYHRKAGGDPAHLLVHDLPSLINGSLWTLSVCIILYILPGRLTPPRTEQAGPENHLQSVRADF